MQGNKYVETNIVSLNVHYTLSYKLYKPESEAQMS